MATDPQPSQHSSRRARILASASVALLLLATAAAHVSAGDPRERGSTVAPGERVVEWKGQSLLRVRGACMDDGATCVGDVSSEAGSFFLDAPSSGGVITVSWRPVDDAFRTLRFVIAGIEVESEAPVRFLSVGLVAGAHEIRVMPARNVTGSYEQVVDWTADLALTPPFDIVETRGLSSYETLAGCLVVACTPKTAHMSDPLIVPWNAKGEIVLEWDARGGPMRASIPGTAIAAEGEPPLVLSASGLAPGEWSVRVEPAGVAAPLASGSVGWSARLTRA